MNLMSDACGRYPEALNGEYDVQPCCANCMHFYKLLGKYGVCGFKCEDELGKETFIDNVLDYVMNEISLGDFDPCERWEEE